MQRKNLARITGSTIPEEHRHPTETCEISKEVANEMGGAHPPNFKGRQLPMLSVIKMLMRMQKPYEEGSNLPDARQHDTMDELFELARDKEERQGTANAI